VFYFLYNFCLKYFSILEDLSEIGFKMYISFHAKYMFFLSDFNETSISSTDFRNILKYKISWKSFQWKPSCCMRTNGQTDITKLIVAFRNFANVHKNDLLYVSVQLVICNHSQQVLEKFIFVSGITYRIWVHVYNFPDTYDLLWFSNLRSVRDRPVRILSIGMTVIQFNVNIHTHQTTCADEETDNSHRFWHEDSSLLGWFAL
jgi:hypothetical protein